MFCCYLFSLPFYALPGFKNINPNTKASPNITGRVVIDPANKVNKPMEYELITIWNTKVGNTDLVKNTKANDNSENINTPIKAVLLVKPNAVVCTRVNVAATPMNVNITFKLSSWVDKEVPIFHKIHPGITTKNNTDSTVGITPATIRFSRVEDPSKAVVAKTDAKETEGFNIEL